MTETPPVLVVREAVASFPDRAHFHRAVANLLAAGFAASDLSVLASHDSLATAGEPAERKPTLFPAGLADGVRFVEPLTAAGIVFLFGGPIAAAVAAVIGAGLSGVAFKEMLDDYTAPPHSENFKAALAAGAALLWVRCDDPAHEGIASRILGEAGGRYVHINERPAHPEESNA